MIKPSQPIVYNFHANFPMFVLFQVIAIPDRSRLSLLITCRPALQRNHVQPCPTMSNHVQPCPTMQLWLLLRPQTFKD